MKFKLSPAPFNGPINDILKRMKKADVISDDTTLFDVSNSNGNFVSVENAAVFDSNVVDATVVNSKRSTIVSFKRSDGCIDVVLSRTLEHCTVNYDDIVLNRQLRKIERFQDVYDRTKAVLTFSFSIFEDQCFMTKLEVLTDNDDYFWLGNAGLLSMKDKTPLLRLIELGKNEIGKFITAVEGKDFQHSYPITENYVTSHSDNHPVVPNQIVKFLDRGELLDLKFEVIDKNKIFCRNQLDVECKVESLSQLNDEQLVGLSFNKLTSMFSYATVAISELSKYKSV